MPSTISRNKPSPRLLTILLPTKPAIKPRIIHARKDIISSSTSGSAAYRFASVADLIAYSMRAGRFFSRRGYILCARRLQNFLRRIDFCGCIAMHRKQNTTLLDSPLITLGLVLWDAHPNERPNQTTHRTTHSEPCECTHYWTGCDERTHSRNCESA